MPNEIATLNSAERSQLRKHEAIIEKGVKTFVEVGASLLCVREDRLYRETHKSFSKYVEDRFGIKKSYAHDLIESSVVAKKVSGIPDTFVTIQNPGQAIELRSVPDEKLCEVVERAVERAAIEDRAVTAKDYREAKQVVLIEEYEDVPDEPFEESSDQADPVVERSKRLLRERLRGVRLDLGNLGFGDQFEPHVAAIEKGAGL